MEIYLEKKREIEQIFLDFLQQDEDQDFSSIFEKQISAQIINRDELFAILQLLSNIAIFSRNFNNSFTKIDQILLCFKSKIKEYLTNYDIFKIFYFNRRVLLFLFNEKILQTDKAIASLCKKEKDEFCYLHYFIKELKPFLDEQLIEKVEAEISEYLGSHADDDEYYEKWRQIGENDRYICQLIRNDSIVEFITYINEESINLSDSFIKPSFFDNCIFFYQSDLSLINYSAYCGSFQIFQYIYSKIENVDNSIFLYATVGNNPEIIQFLEDKNIEFNFKDVLSASIDCFHNDMANYFINNYSGENEDFENAHLQAIVISNYAYFPEDLNKPLYFYYFCKYNYITIVKVLLKSNQYDLNSIIKDVF